MNEPAAVLDMLLWTIAQIVSPTQTALYDLRRVMATERYVREPIVKAVGYWGEELGWEEAFATDDPIQWITKAITEPYREYGQ